MAYGLALRGDAFWVRTESDAVTVAGVGRLAASEGEASRVRLTLEGSRRVDLEGGALTPSLEVGLRQDGGDAETGTGLELGGGVAYADPASGLAMDLKARTLVAHAESGYREWGVSGAVKLQPGGAGRGLSFSLLPAFGADAGGDRLWSARDAAQLAPANDATLIAITGGKDVADAGAVIARLDKVRAKYDDMVLLHGGGPGVEKVAAQWAERNAVHQVVCKPDWDRHGRAAPFRRNDELLDLLPKGVIAFPGSGITGNLVDKAVKLGIPVQRCPA